MGGVDRHDQILKYYSLSRKAMKWYKKYFMHLFDLCVFNSACLYRKNPINATVRDLAFREQLVNEILGYTGPHPAANARSKPPNYRRDGENPPRLTEKHFLSSLPRTPNEIAKGVKNNFRVCAICPSTATAGQKRKRSVTQYWCEDCGVALCVVPCFKKYHSQIGL